MQFPTTLLLALTTLTTLATALPGAPPSSTVITLAVVSPASPTPTPDPNALLNCGDARYKASQYSCFNNKSLCPIEGGVKYQLCEGDGGCFDPAKYHCQGGHLAQVVGF